jgi:glucokinase
MSALTLALDVDGTTIAAGLVDADGALVHTATRPTSDAGAETVWAVVDGLIADGLRAPGGVVGAAGIAPAGGPVCRHRQPDQHRRLARLPAARPGHRRAAGGRQPWPATGRAWRSASTGAAPGAAQYLLGMVVSTGDDASR